DGWRGAPLGLRDLDRSLDVAVGAHARRRRGSDNGARLDGRVARCAAGPIARIVRRRALEECGQSRRFDGDLPQRIEVPVDGERAGRREHERAIAHRLAEGAELLTLAPPVRVTRDVARIEPPRVRPTGLHWAARRRMRALLLLHDGTMYTLSACGPKATGRNRERRRRRGGREGGRCSL